ncbi:MAG TPA: branched-chain amino acid ABC transporter permease [Methylomirabilota bacterium]|jgi:branched-chain amino acid transport system permease protein|nr:branched-chain amino acid ABC transporter permease [Methylomirabilota bacterium]
MSSERPATLAVAALVLCGLPFTTSNAYYLDIIVQIYMWGAAAAAWNLLGGYAGQFSLGHAAFFGIGAYTSSLLLLTVGLTPWLGMLAGGALATLFALVIGYLAIRLRGPFFTLATIALAEVLQILAVYFRGLTGGSQGLSLPFAASVARFTFDAKRAYALTGLGFLFFALLVTWLVERSRLGYYLVAVREEEDAARAVGVPVLRVKLIATAASAFLTSMIGTFYAQYVLWIEPAHTFSLDISVQLALMAIIGGLGTLLGPVVGAALIIPLNMFLRAWLGASLTGLYLVVYGLVLVLVVLYARQGLIVEARGWLARCRPGTVAHPA